MIEKMLVSFSTPPDLTVCFLNELVIIEITSGKIKADKKNKSEAEGNKMGKKAQYVYELLLLAVAAFILSVAVESLFNAEQIVPGGVTGIGILLQSITHDRFGLAQGIPIWFTNLACNIPLFIGGFRLLSRDSMIKTIYTTTLLSVFLAILPRYEILTDNRLLNILVGGFLFGMAYGIMFRLNASSGGVDLLALILNHFRRDISIPVILAIIDIGIVTAGAVALGLENIMYAAIAIVISAKVADRIVQGFRQGKMAYIISSQSDAIKNYIISGICRGVTLVDVRGGYSASGRVMIISVLSSRQLVELKEKIIEIDENAFLIVGQITEVFGEGFTKMT